MSEYTVGQGGDFPTLAAAAKAVKPGDVVRVMPGVYREVLVCDVPGVTWYGEGDATIDGGWDGKTKTSSWQTQLAITAPGVTVDGLVVRNCPGRAVGVMADDVLFQNCLLEVTYRGAILVGDSSSAAIENVVIRGNTMRRMSLSWVVGDRGANGRSVNGSFNVQNVRAGLIEHNILHDGYGEGINIGRGSDGVTVRENTVYSTAHVLIYVNRAQRTNIIGNRLYHIPNPLYGGPKGDRMSAAIVIGDEGGPITSQHPASEGTIIRDNLVVNAGALLQVRNNANNYDTQLLDTVIENNTFVAGPSTRDGIIIQSNQRGRPHRDNVFRRNVIHFDNAPAGADIGSHGQGSGVAFESNAWSGKPPKAMQSAGDIYGDLMLANPGANDLGPVGLRLDNYRPAAGSPLGLPVGWIGALAPAVVEPEEPPPDPEPVPPVVDAAAVREQLAVIRLAADEIERLVEAAARPQIKE